MRVFGWSEGAQQKVFAKKTTRQLGKKNKTAKKGIQAVKEVTIGTP